MKEDEEHHVAAAHSGRIESEKPGKRGGQPAYRQIELQLRKEISSGVFPSGARLPTEEELMQRFEVSRHTVRGAILRLVNDGTVERFAGRGTFVSDATHASGSWGAKSLEDIIRKTFPGDLEVLSIEMVAATQAADAAISLQVGPDEQLLRIDTIRRARGIPLNYAIAHVPQQFSYKLPENLADALQEKRLLLLVEEYNALSVLKLRQSFSACLADAGIAKKLDVEPNSALVRFRNTYFGVDNLPIETSVTYCSPDRHNPTIELYREHVY